MTYHAHLHQDKEYAVYRHLLKQAAPNKTSLLKQAEKTFCN
jgi:hypothetical protein